MDLTGNVGKCQKSQNLRILLSQIFDIVLLGLLRRFLEPGPDSVIVLLCMSFFNRALHHSGELEVSPVRV